MGDGSLQLISSALLHTLLSLLVGVALQALFVVHVHAAGFSLFEWVRGRKRELVLGIIEWNGMDGEGLGLEGEDV